MFWLEYGLSFSRVQLQSENEFRSDSSLFESVKRENIMKPAAVDRSFSRVKYQLIAVAVGIIIYCYVYSFDIHSIKYVFIYTEISFSSKVISSHSVRDVMLVGIRRPCQLSTVFLARSTTVHFRKQRPDGSDHSWHSEQYLVAWVLAFWPIR